MTHNTEPDIEQLLQQYGADRRQQQTAANSVLYMARRQRRTVAALASVAVILLAAAWLFRSTPDTATTLSATMHTASVPQTPAIEETPNHNLQTTTYQPTDTKPSTHKTHHITAALTPQHGTAQAESHALLPEPETMEIEKNEELLKGAQEGNIESMNLLARAYYNGIGRVADYSKAFSLWQKTAEMGDAEGLFWIGALYGTGDIVSQDYTTSTQYFQKSADQGYADALYLSMAGMGFLIPPKTLLSSSQNRGWISLAMILLSLFCYTALTTAKDRLLWGPIIPEHPDMELMMETILVNAEPLMIIISIYFVAQFAFSKVGQMLGSLAWFRGIIAIPCLYAFLGYLCRLFTMRMFFFANHWVYYSPIMWFIVQPVTIYLVVFLYRLIRERRKMKEERVSWKELAKL